MLVQKEVTVGSVAWFVVANAATVAGKRAGRDWRAAVPTNAGCSLLGRLSMTVWSTLGTLGTLGRFWSPTGATTTLTEGQTRTNSYRSGRNLTSCPAFRVDGGRLTTEWVGTTRSTTGTRESASRLAQRSR